MSELDPRYEMHEAQLQFWAEIGYPDNHGIGRMEHVEHSCPFPSRDKAEQWLEEQGWTYDKRLMRRTHQKHHGMITRVREVKEFRFEKWITKPA